MQPTTIKSKDNGCGTAPGNLVNIHYSNNKKKYFLNMIKYSNYRTKSGQFTGYFEGKYILFSMGWLTLTPSTNEA